MLALYLEVLREVVDRVREQELLPRKIAFGIEQAWIGELLNDQQQKKEKEEQEEVGSSSSSLSGNETPKLESFSAFDSRLHSLCAESEGRFPRRIVDKSHQGEGVENRIEQALLRARTALAQGEQALGVLVDPRLASRPPTRKRKRDDKDGVEQKISCLLGPEDEEIYLCGIYSKDEEDSGTILIKRGLIRLKRNEEWPVKNFRVHFSSSTSNNGS